MQQRPRRVTGFTLIEILVVMVIVGIIVTLAAVNFSRSDTDALQHEAERLALLLESARDEAIAAGAPLAFGRAEQGYGFWKQDADGAWQLLEDNQILRVRQLPEAVRVADMRVNLLPLPPDGRVIFTPSGVNAPFTVELRAGEVVRKLNADALGRMTLEVPGLQAGTTTGAS
ncbi:GspH/FimT family pseudopilin [Chitinimonas viridis]|uniref:Type II secretion system protein H n=1 Tax=Chitinimonas viridis TaxID=664880 RepID=A0ABT8B484_9NEIS|nr:GspH/FimT family pseudopilin [Chitinimonas viridis]MDN3576299.1 GspH/FimT family pseudopilin [Chitinimonas viridis]